MRAPDVAMVVAEARRTGSRVLLGSDIATPPEVRLLDPNLFVGEMLLDAENLTVSVPAAYSLEQLQASLAEAGLFYPPAADLQGASTVGAHLAAATCGPWRLGRGTTRDWVLGLEVVTGQGEVIRTGSGVVKNVAGLDLTKLIIGSRGRLCIITRATLRLAPLPPGRAVAAARFSSPAKALKALPDLLSTRLNPGAIELWDDRLLVGLEGAPVDLPRRREMALQALRKAGGTVLEANSVQVPALTEAVVLVRAGLPAGKASVWIADLPPNTPVRGHAGNGLYHAGLPADTELLRDLQARAIALHGYMQIGSAPIDGQASGVARIEAGIKQAFDPDQIFREGSDG